MNRHLPLVLICLGSVACQSTYSNKRMSVDDDALVRVPVAERESINKAREEHLQAQDRIAVAEQAVEAAQADLDIAKRTAGVSHDEMSVAQERCDIARKLDPETRQDAIRTADRDLDAVCAHARWADAQVDCQERVIEEKQAQVDLEKRRVDLAEAKVELAKAKAVNTSDSTDRHEYDVSAFESVVTARQLDVDLAEIDRDAWQKKLRLCRDAVEARADAVPTSYGTTWRSMDAIPAASPAKK